MELIALAAIAIGIMTIFIVEKLHRIERRTIEILKVHGETLRVLNDCAVNLNWIAHYAAKGQGGQQIGSSLPNP